MGENSPDILHNTVLYLLGINLALRAGDNHYDLRCDHCGRKSHLSFENNKNGVNFFWGEDTVTKTNDGGLNDMQKERKIMGVPQQRSKSGFCKTSCQVLFPQNTTKGNLYLRSLDKPTVKRCYGDQVVGQTKLRSAVNDMHAFCCRYQ